MSKLIREELEKRLGENGERAVIERMICIDADGLPILSMLTLAKVVMEDSTGWWGLVHQPLPEAKARINYAGGMYGDLAEMLDRSESERYLLEIERAS